MTREIDPDAIKSGTLTYAEAVYLKDRGRLPADYEMPEPDEGEDESESAPVRSRVTPLEEQDSPTIGNSGGIVDDDEEGEKDWENGYNNNQLRAELSKRDLSVNGKKDELIARLRRWEADELLDSDQSEV